MRKGSFRPGGAAASRVGRTGHPHFAGVAGAGAARRNWIAGDAIAAGKPERQSCGQQQHAIAYLHHLVVVVVLLLDGLVLKPAPDEPELPMELVLPLEPPVLPLLLVVSLLPVEPVVEPLVPAVLPVEPEPMLPVDGLVGLVLLDEFVEPGVPAVPASRLLQALSESAATTARVATAQ